MSTLTALPVGDELEYEGQYYTDWRCAICKTWRRRDTAARIIVRHEGVRVMCMDHPTVDEDEDDCDCHCHAHEFCPDCGDLS